MEKKKEIETWIPPEIQIDTKWLPPPPADEEEEEEQESREAEEKS